MPSPASIFNLNFSHYLQFHAITLISSLIATRVNKFFSYSTGLLCLQLLLD